LSGRTGAGSQRETIKAAEEPGFSLTWEELESMICKVKGTGDELSDDASHLIAGKSTLGKIPAWVGEDLKKLFDLCPFCKTENIS
jgi:hypothetical protein